MLLLLSHDIMITPYLLWITTYHAIDCALPIMTVECCAWLTHIHYMNTYMPSMPFISHTHIQGQTIARHYINPALLLVNNKFFRTPKRNNYQALPCRYNQQNSE
jgi:hypothetical protein